MQRLRRFARYWDLVANSGNFVEAVPLLWGDHPPLTRALSPSTGRGESPAPRVETPLPSGERNQMSGGPFWSFLRFSDWLYAQTKQTHAIALARLKGLVARYLKEEMNLPETEVAALSNKQRTLPRTAAARQARHLANR